MLDGVVLDKYERPILSLRITLTNRCNVNCLYCHHDGMVKSKDEMTADEYFVEKLHNVFPYSLTFVKFEEESEK